jgi:hypothetical protein
MNSELSAPQRDHRGASARTDQGRDVVAHLGERIAAAGPGFVLVEAGDEVGADVKPIANSARFLPAVDASIRGKRSYDRTQCEKRSAAWRGKFLDAVAVAGKNVCPKVPLSISTSGLDRCSRRRRRA